MVSEVLMSTDLKITGHKHKKKKEIYVVLMLHPAKDPQ